MKASFTQMLKTYCYESHILNHASTLLKGDISENRAIFYNRAGQGLRTSSIVTKDQGVKGLFMYDCGHLLPKEYSDPKLCFTCAEKEQIKGK